jgi:hypothetical protein
MQWLVGVVILVVYRNFVGWMPKATASQQQMGRGVFWYKTIWASFRQEKKKEGRRLLTAAYSID